MEATTCQCPAHRRTSRGTMAKGTESYTSTVGICGRPVESGSMCRMHAAAAAKVAAKLAAR